MSMITYLTRIEFGEGQISRLQEFLDGLGVKRSTPVSMASFWP